MNQPKSVEKENILERLKRETETAHQQTEQLMPFDDAQFSAADYLALLVKFYAFYKPFEPTLEAAIVAQKLDFDYRERLKTPKLLADLRVLKMSEKRIAEIESANDLPSLASAEEIFGALYVVEGSTLGGQVISRLLKTKFGFDESNGASFFDGYAAQTGKMWNDFRSKISEFAEQNPDGGNKIIRAANETFEKIGRVLAVK